MSETRIQVKPFKESHPVNVQPPMVFEFKAGEKDIQTVLRPITDLVFEVIAPSDGGEKYVRLLTNDLYGPSMYLAMTMENAKNLFEKITDSIRESEQHPSET